jgi:SAM-dependent methyltransferase
LDALPRSADSHLAAVYRHRFSRQEEERKRDVWLEVGRFLQRFIRHGSRVLDIGSDSGYFVASIQASEKVATDVRDVSASMPRGVRFVQCNSLDLRQALPPAYFDAVLISNFLEHLESSEAVVEQLRVAYDLLNKGGRVIILQPNIRLTKEAYWDFIDHKTPLNERSLMEAAELAGFRHHTVTTRFLPYTTKSRLPQSRYLVRLYLSFRPAWWLFGKQTLYVGEKG